MYISLQIAIMFQALGSSVNIALYGFLSSLRLPKIQMLESSVVEEGNMSVRQQPWRSDSMSLSHIIRSHTIFWIGTQPRRCQCTGGYKKACSKAQPFKPPLSSHPLRLAFWSRLWARSDSKVCIHPIITRLVIEPLICVYPVAHRELMPGECWG